MRAGGSLPLSITAIVSFIEVTNSYIQLQVSLFCLIRKQYMEYSQLQKEVQLQLYYNNINYSYVQGQLLYILSQLYHTKLFTYCLLHSKKWLHLRRIREAVFNIRLCYIRKITYTNPVFISVYAMYGRSQLLIFVYVKYASLRTQHTFGPFVFVQYVDCNRITKRSQ